MSKLATIAFIILLGCFMVAQVYCAPGSVTKMPNTAFTKMSGNGGVIRADSAKSAVYFRGSSVTINPVTKTITINGTGTGGGVTVHGNLTGRDVADSHPQSAITDLVSDLAAILQEFRNYTGSKKGLPGYRKPYDGRSQPPPLSMIIDGDAQTITYDATGRNPQPAELTFIGYVLEGLAVLTQNITWNWYSPGAPGTTQISPPAAEMEGMQNHRQTYTVTALEGYSSHRTANWVRLQGVYSSPRWPWGKRQVTTRLPISVIKSGS